MFLHPLVRISAVRTRLRRDLGRFPGGLEVDAVWKIQGFASDITDMPGKQVPDLSDSGLGLLNIAVSQSILRHTILKSIATSRQL